MTTPYASCKTFGLDLDRPAGLTATRPCQKATVKIDHVSFSQVMQAVNPLNHLPIVSGLMQQSHAAENAANPLMPAAKLIGSTLLGGVPGFFVGLASAVYHEMAGATATAAGAATAYRSVADAHKRDAELFG